MIENDYSTIILSFVSIILTKISIQQSIDFRTLLEKKNFSHVRAISRFSLVVSRQTDFVQTSENRRRRVETYRWNVVRGERKGRGDGAEGYQAIGRELSITGVFRDEKLHREQKRGWIDKGLVGWKISGERGNGRPWQSLVLVFLRGINRDSTTIYKNWRVRLSLACSSWKWQGKGGVEEETARRNDKSRVYFLTDTVRFLYRTRQH